MEDDPRQVSSSTVPDLQIPFVVHDVTTRGPEGSICYLFRTCSERDVGQDDGEDHQNESGYSHHAGVGHGPGPFGFDARNGRDGGDDACEAEQHEPVHDITLADGMRASREMGTGPA